MAYQSPLDPERALHAAVLSLLKTAPAVKALVGGRVHDEPPVDAVHPYLALSRAETRSWGSSGGGAAGEGVEHVLTLTCVSRFGGTEEAKAVVAAVRAALQDARPVLDGHRVVTLRAAYGDVFRAADWRFTYGVLRVRAVTEPLD
jgi:hypothetical protein